MGSEVNRRKPVRIKEIMGLARGWKIDAQKFKDAARAEDQ